MEGIVHQRSWNLNSYARLSNRFLFSLPNQAQFKSYIP